MTDLVAALGLVLVIEGALWALFPGLATSMMEAASRIPVDTLRLGGLMAACAGLVVVWLVRG